MSDAVCRNCERPGVDVVADGICMRCYSYRRRVGALPPRELIRPQTKYHRQLAVRLDAASHERIVSESARERVTPAEWVRKLIWRALAASP